MSKLNILIFSLLFVASVNAEDSFNKKHEDYRNCLLKKPQSLVKCDLEKLQLKSLLHYYNMWKNPAWDEHSKLMQRDCNSLNSKLNREKDKFFNDSEVSDKKAKKAYKLYKVSSKSIKRYCQIEKRVREDIILHRKGVSMGTKTKPLVKFPYTL